MIFSSIFITNIQKNSWDEKILTIKLIFHYEERVAFFILKNGRGHMRNESRKNKFVYDFLFFIFSNKWKHNKNEGWIQYMLNLKDDKGVQKNLNKFY